MVKKWCRILAFNLNIKMFQNIIPFSSEFNSIPLIIHTFEEEI